MNRRSFNAYLLKLMSLYFFSKFTSDSKSAFSKTKEEYYKIPFEVKIYGRNDVVLDRLLVYEGWLQEYYNQSYVVMTDERNHGESKERLNKWQGIAEATRSIDVAVSTDKFGLAGAIIKGGERRVVIDEGFITAALSFAFAEAHAGAQKIAKNEYLYWLSNFYDALKFNDPIPFLGGYDLFYKFFVDQDFKNERFGNSFFEGFGKCLTNIYTYVIYHEIGHHYLGHLQRLRKNSQLNNKQLHQKLEIEADEFSIDVCQVGLNINAAQAIFYFNLFNFMRLNILKERGFQVTQSHPDPIERYRKNIEFLGKKRHDLAFSEWQKKYFEEIIEFLQEIGVERREFDDKRFGVISIVGDVPDSYKRFYRRDCNLVNFRNSGMTISGPDGENAVFFGANPYDFSPLGSCKRVFIP